MIYQDDSNIIDETLGETPLLKPVKLKRFTIDNVLEQTSSKNISTVGFEKIKEEKLEEIVVKDNLSIPNNLNHEDIIGSDNTVKFVVNDLDTSKTNKDKYSNRFKKIWKIILDWLTKHKKKIFLALQISSVLIVLSLVLVTLKVYNDYNKLGDVREKIENAFKGESSKILDKNGKVLYDYRNDSKKEALELDKIPEIIKNALIVREQERFYLDPSGIPWYSILGAGANCGKIVLTKSSESCRGGSGLYQQLIKNATGNNDGSLGRKYTELLQSVKVSKELSKEDILKLYLNNMPFGRDSKGVQAGFKSYFGHGVNDTTNPVNPAQACMIASMPNRPDGYNTAIKNEFLGAQPDTTSNNTWVYFKKLIDDCLDKLATKELKEGQKPTISQDEAEKYKAFSFKDYGFLPYNGLVRDDKGNLVERKYPYLIDYIKRELQTKFGDEFGDDESTISSKMTSGGYVIKTTFDLDLQDKMEKTLSENRFSLDDSKTNNFGSVVLDTQTSEVRAMIGNLDYNTNQTNRAAGPFSYFKPGSSIKPYIYAGVFSDEIAFNPSTVMPDITYNPGNYKVTNFGGDLGHGAQPIRTALQHSYNITAQESIYLMQNTGYYNESVSANYAKSITDDLGLKFLTSKENKKDGPENETCVVGAQFAIGSCDMSAISHANAMATVLNQGIYTEASPLVEIKGPDGVLIYSSQNKNGKYKNANEAINKAVANQVADVLSDTVTRGSYFGSQTSNFEIEGWNGANNIAAKTGSGQIECSYGSCLGDASMIGGTPYYTLLTTARIENPTNGARIGYNPRPYKDSGNVVGSVFKALNKSIHEGLTPKGFSKDGLTKVTLDATNGLLPEKEGVPIKQEYLTPSQKKKLEDVKGRVYKDGDSVTKTRTIFPYGKNVSIFGGDNLCYKTIPLFPNVGFMNDQVKSLAPAKPACSYKPLEKEGKDKLTVTGIVSGGDFEVGTNSLVAKAIAGIAENPTTPVNNKKIAKIKINFYNPETKQTVETEVEGDTLSLSKEADFKSILDTKVIPGKVNVTFYIINSEDEVTKFEYTGVNFKIKKAVETEVKPANPSAPITPTTPTNPIVPITPNPPVVPGQGGATTPKPPTTTTTVTPGTPVIVTPTLPLSPVVTSPIVNQ
jgi:penicillin-binding protein 1A